MNWAKLVAKAKENRARSSAMGARGTLFVFGAMLALAGGLDLYSIVKHQIRGRPGAATLVERIQQCTVEYQVIGAKKQKEQWPCKQAEDFQRLAGPNKIQISRQFIARVRFAREDGHTQEANVDEVDLDSFGLAVGATLPVTYLPDNPGDVRAKTSWKQVNVSLILLAVGIPCLMLALGIPLSSPFRWAFRTLRGPASRAAEG